MANAFGRREFVAAVPICDPASRGVTDGEPLLLLAATLGHGEIEAQLTGRFGGE